MHNMRRTNDPRVLRIALVAALDSYGDACRAQGRADVAHHCLERTDESPTRTRGQDAHRRVKRGEARERVAALLTSASARGLTNREIARLAAADDRSLAESTVRSALSHLQAAGKARRDGKHWFNTIGD